MNKIYLSIIFIVNVLCINFQASLGQERTNKHQVQLRLKERSKNALSGSAFALQILPDSISLTKRESLIFKQVKQGNVPDFYRHMRLITDSLLIDGKIFRVCYYVTADYLAIGNNDDYFYISPTPALAQKIANLVHCKLPTRKMSDNIYRQSTIKLEPHPIPPSKTMTTVSVFLKHNDIIKNQLSAINKSSGKRPKDQLIAGNKKDIIISNKIYGERTKRVVIYGWHKLDGKAIQPLYNKHTDTWADYSHGMRLISDIVYVNNKKTSVKRLLSHSMLHSLLSDEGIIVKSSYPIK